VSETTGGTQLPSQDERTMAALAHVLQMVGWWMAPLIIFLIKRQSRFASFHAWQALLLQIVYIVFIAGLMVLWFGSFFMMMIAHHSMEKSTSLPAAFLLFPLIWLGLIGMWMVMLVIAIVYGIKAGRGEWAQYPLLGRFALKILKIGPGGEALSPPFA
jgi:uncharacterized Tic20 family protein